MLQESVGFQRPNREAVKAVPELVSTCQEPSLGTRAAMSSLPSPVKSPTVANWNAAAAPQARGVAVPDAGVVVTHQVPAAVCTATSLRPSPSKSPPNEFTQVSPAGSVASGVVANDEPLARLTISSVPAMPMTALFWVAGSGDATTITFPYWLLPAPKAEYWKRPRPAP